MAERGDDSRTPYVLWTYPPRLLRPFTLTDPLSRRGTFAQRAERVRDHWVCAGFPVAPPLWMDVPSAEAPAFAGMTGVGGNDGVG